MIKNFIRTYLRWAYIPFVSRYRKFRAHIYRKKICESLSRLDPLDKRIFYLGITEQPNLGDMAQHYCIKKWIKENYPDWDLVMVRSSVITDPAFTDVFFSVIKKIFHPDNIILFQSGYCTQDLGGDHTLMHKLVCDQLPYARILMMPQTVYFQYERNKFDISKNHNNAKKMLFLARDYVSYKEATEMFPDIKVEAYPDIVTTLIGSFSFDNKRDGICMCLRNDSEKYYTDTDLNSLKNQIMQKGITVYQKDTQGHNTVDYIRKNLEKVIVKEIESYSKFKLVITDRYHGTIFSLCSGTPVIIIKTTDHKVVTGADWFKGVYDDHVFVAEDLNDAYKLCMKLYSSTVKYSMMPYFKQEYYDNLKSKFENL